MISTNSTLLNRKLSITFKARILWSVLIYLISLYPILVTLITPRIFTKNKADIDYMQNNQSSYISLLNKTIVVVLLIIGLIIFIYAVVHRYKFINSRMALLFLGLLIYKCSLLISSLFGTVQHLDVNTIISLVVYIMLFLLPMPKELVINTYKKILLIYIYGSIITAVVYPSFSIQFNYNEGMFPIRLFGVTSHANTLAGIISIYFLLELFVKSNSKLRFLNLTIASLSMILTQSKTSWIILLVVLATKFFLSLGYFSKSKKSIMLFFALVSFIIGLLIVLIYNLILHFAQLIAPAEKEELFTLTGRTYLWKFTIDVWKNNIIFGHGINVWGDLSLKSIFLNRYGWAPDTAHNLFIQILGMAGLAGLIGLIVYLIMIIITILKIKKSNYKLVCFLFFAIILIRSITEVSLTNNITDCNFLLEQTLITILISLFNYHDNSRWGVNND